MTRTDWLLALGAGLCGGLLPACTHTTRDQLAPSSMETCAACAAPHPAAREHPADAPASPYHPLPDAPPPPPSADPWDVKDKPDRVKPIEPVRYREGHLEVDLEAPAPPARITPVAPPPAEIKPVAVAAPLVSAAKPAAGEAPLLNALRCYLDKRPAEAIALLEPFEKTTQDVLLGLLPLAALLAEGGIDKAGDKEAAVLLDQLNSLMVPLRARAALVIDKLCFCRGIGGFGVYEPLPPEHLFRPGELVRVYVELRNFSSEKRETGSGQAAFVTRLASAAEIRDYAGKQIWTQEFHRDRPDQSQTLRRDYFEHYRFCLPDLPPGPYTLWLKVTDVPTQRTVKRSLDFHVAIAPARP